MRTPKLFGLVAVAVLAVVALTHPAPAAAQHDRISAPSQSVEPASPPPPAPEPPPPPPPPPPPDPAPPPEPSAPPESSAPPSVPEEHMRTAEPAPAPTDPGTSGRRIAIEPPPAPDARPTDPGTAGRRIPPPPVPYGGDEPPYWPPDFPDGSLLGDMETFDESPLPEEMSAVARELDADLVLVQVFVSDPGGKPVTGLKKDDFLLFVDGEAVPIASFYAQTAAAAPGADRALLERLVGLQTFYSLGFAPARPADGRERRIAVVVKGRPGLAVRARERRPEEGL